MSGTSLTFNPYVTTNGQGLFGVKSTGLRQGTAYPDPSAIARLRGGILDVTETLPMWGGVAIYENVPGVAGAANPALGPTVGRANGLTGSKALAGWSVFDSNYAMVTSPQSTVPLIGGGGQVNSYALKSNARIIVQADPVLIDLRGGPIGAQVSWDWINQRLVPYVASAATVKSTGSTYTSGTGVVLLQATAALDGFDVGDAIVVSGLTGSGADLADANGTYTILTKPAADMITYEIATGLTIATITGGTITPGSGAATAIPVTVLDIQESNCETVVYDPATGFATYNFDGCCAVIQI